VPDHEIKLVPVDHEVALAVGGLVQGIIRQLDASEIDAEIVAQELVMVARKVDEARPFPDLAQELLHHVVVGLRPVPTGFQLPSVDNVADEIDGVRIIGLEEVEQGPCLAPPGAEVEVRQEQRSHAYGICILSHGPPRRVCRLQPNRIRISSP
jgi:hypothetical protein